MFGLWGKKKPKLLWEPNEIYATRASADGALVRAAVASELPVIVSSFFPTSLRRIEATFASQGVALPTLGKGNWPKQPFSSDARWSLHADLMIGHYGFESWLARTERPFSFLFVECYPMTATERLVLDLLERVSTPNPQRVRFFVGLDEPLLAAFGGERLVPIMKALGLGPEDRISHPWVDKSLAKARAKIEKQVHHASPADSDTEWYARNLQRP